MRIAIHLGLIFGLFGVIPNTDSQESTACRGTNVTGCSSGRIDRDQDTVSDAAARTEAVRIAQARGWSTGGRKSGPDPFTDEVSVSASFSLYAQRSAEWDSRPLLLGAVDCLSNWESEPLVLVLTTLGSTLGSGNLKYRFDSSYGRDRRMVDARHKRPAGSELICRPHGRAQQGHRGVGAVSRGEKTGHL